MSDFQLLMVKTSSLGDIVHTLPAIHDIQTHRPDVVIDWLIEPAFADIALLNPNLRELVTVESKKISRHKWKMLWSDDYREFKQRLRACEYDLLIDAQGLLKSAFMTTIAKRKAVSGFNKQSVREPIASWFYSNTCAVPKTIHAVERTRRLCALALDYDYPNARAGALPNGVATTDTEDFPLVFVPDFSASTSGKSLIFCHGSSRMDKTLPIEDWRKLATLATDAGFSVQLPHGNNAERATAAAIADNIDGVTVMPTLTLAEMITAFKQCDGAIGVDTGFTHLAGALNKPTVGLYGATDPKLCGALGRYATNIESPEFIDRKVRKIDKSNHSAGLTGLDIDAAWETFSAQYAKSRT